jgi:hypothetical protein
MMLKIIILAFVISVPLVTSANAYPTPLSKDECMQMVGTAWDEAQDKCVWNQAKKEGCVQLAGKAWDEAQNKCIDKVTK